MLKNLIIANSYYDSASLMLLTNKIKEKLNLSTEDVAIMMATDMNKRIIEESNLLNDDGREAKASDILIALNTDLSDNEVLLIVNDLLNKKDKTKKVYNKEISFTDDAISQYDDTNFAVISIPGAYAKREVKKLLNAGKNILLFSDNISIEDEIKLKELAVSKNLLMMGPDCGTSIINGIGLGFANKVNRGNIGIVAASGTGLQELTCIISNNGGGISQAYGTGGRDIKNAVGGIMSLYCLDRLIEDDDTDIIAIVSKPPEKQVLNKIIEKVRDIKKPVLACFLGAESSDFDNSNIIFCETIEELALKTLEFSGKIVEEKDFDVKVDVKKGYIRGIYCGGTLAYETLLMLEKNNFEVYSNLSKLNKVGRKDKSIKNTIIDMGDDEFTIGSPHPMIDPSKRSLRIMEEVMDSDVSIILADVCLGYASNDNLADILAEDIKQAMKIRQDLVFIVNICGSKLDYQGYDNKKKILEDSGAIVVDTNAKAVKLAMKLLKEKR